MINATPVHEKGSCPTPANPRTSITTPSTPGTTMPKLNSSTTRARPPSDTSKKAMLGLARNDKNCSTRLSPTERTCRPSVSTVSPVESSAPSGIVVPSS
jgi:hypothetical protein